MCLRIVSTGISPSKCTIYSWIPRGIPLTWMHHWGMVCLLDIHEIEYLYLSNAPSPRATVTNTCKRLMPLSNWAHPPRSQLARTPLVAHATAVAVSPRNHQLLPPSPNWYSVSLPDCSLIFHLTPVLWSTSLILELEQWLWKNNLHSLVLLDLCAVNGVDDVLLSVFTYLTVEVCSVSKISSISRVNDYPILLSVFWFI